MSPACTLHVDRADRGIIQSFVMPKENLDAEGNESLLTKKRICPIHAEPIHGTSDLVTCPTRPRQNAYRAGERIHPG